MNEAWSTEYNICVGRLCRHVDFTLHFGSWDWVFLLFCKIALFFFFFFLFFFFPKKLYFPFECVCWVLSVAQFASPAFPTKKWVERGGNTIATIMNHCNARNMITKWLSSSIDNQSSLCGFYIPVAFSIYLINSFLCLSLSALVWSWFTRKIMNFASGTIKTWSRTTKGTNQTK